MADNSVYSFFDVSESFNDNYSNSLYSTGVDDLNLPYELSNDLKEQSSTRKSIQKYRSAWERIPGFKNWLRPVPGNPYKASCIACKKTVVAEVMVLRKHSIANKHVKQMTKMRHEEMQKLINENEPSECSDDDDNGSSEDGFANIDDNSRIERPMDVIEQMLAAPKQSDQTNLKREFNKHKSDDVDNYDGDDDDDDDDDMYDYNDDKDDDDDDDDDYISVSDEDSSDNDDTESVDSFEDNDSDDENDESNVYWESSDDENPLDVKKKIYKFPLIQVEEPAPYWECTAIVHGEVVDLKLTDYEGRFLVMFFYNQNFSALCLNEVGSISDRIELFRQFNTEVVACSVDSHYSHLAWSRISRDNGGIANIRIPLLSDVNHKISKTYGCYDPEEGIAQRAVFIIDPRRILRHVAINDTEVGRSAEEILRLVSTLHYAAKHKNRSSEV